MDKYMKIADNLAKENLSTNEGGPFGACIVKGEFIIGKGSNKVLKNNDPTAHAEIMAIRNACENLNTYDLSESTIYTNCYPCPMCLSAIIWANIKEVYYGNTKIDADNIGFKDEYIYDYLKLLSNNTENEKVLKIKQIDRDETIKTFDQFKEKTDKTIY